MPFSRRSDGGSPSTTHATRNPARRFTVVSTCPESWGGSEELWAGAAVALAERGHGVAAYKTALDGSHPRIRQLESLSCAVRRLPRFSLSQPLTTRAQLLSLAPRLAALRPDLVVVSQGDNYDGLHFGYLCRKLRLPYTLVSQKATDHFWPPDRSRAYRRGVFAGAARCFFVSEHNRRLTEDQLGAPLANAAVVRNPYLVPPDEQLPWLGGEEATLRLACVARLYLLDKGQDILLRVLAREKWKGRALHVSFYGRGVNRDGLVGLAARLGVRNVSFEGQTADVRAVWATHHALVLASRAEGLPLSLVEAMMCARPAVVTKVGGCAEVVEDGVTGFLADPSEDSLDAALEAAWSRRAELREMGRLAAGRIRRLVPADPAADFADALARAGRDRSAARRVSDEGAGGRLS
ncbi:MAG: glycosyltransferase family 4 protein [Acidobacteria bacterium]|nr:glycosyltransferase family 4 protein [Acidobacteriota bacterium]